MMIDKRPRPIDLPDITEGEVVPQRKNPGRVWTFVRRLLREMIWLTVLLAVGVVAVKWWNARDLLPANGVEIQPFLMRDMDGTGKSITDFRGKTVLLHFWAPWCGVCKMEVGRLNALNADLPDGAALVAVALDSTADDVAAFIKTHDVEYPVYLADDRVGKQLQIRQFPTTYALNRQGRIVARDAGWSPTWNFRRMLNSADGFK